MTSHETFVNFEDCARQITVSDTEDAEVGALVNGVCPFVVLSCCGLGLLWQDPFAPCGADALLVDAEARIRRGRGLGRLFVGPDC